MNLSYWEINQWFKKIDFTIIGSGIVGIHCALHLKKIHPKSKILILEKGTLPQGASTKNAGFACFGSVSEIVDDLNTHTEDEMLKLIEMRYRGLQFLRQDLGDDSINFKQYGGYELFETKKNSSEYFDKISTLNKLIYPIFKKDVFRSIPCPFPFKNIDKNVIFNCLEGQINTGKMMHHLLKKANANDITILNQQEVISFQENTEDIEIKTSEYSFKTRKIIFTTNGFAKQLINQEVTPARAQVLITSPIKNLDIKGTFHLDKGYYYFRNINNRILLGGGRNLDFQGETTTNFGTSEIIQTKLENLLKETILPNKTFSIEHKWSGIMGVGNQKKPIIKQISDRVYCGVRLGGMGVAIGSIVGKELAELTK